MKKWPRVSRERESYGGQVFNSIARKFGNRKETLNPEPVNAHRKRMSYRGG